MSWAAPAEASSGERSGPAALDTEANGVMPRLQRRLDRLPAGNRSDFRTHGAMVWPRYVASIIKPDLAISFKRE
jgi:hypothetical protein